MIKQLSIFLAIIMPMFIHCMAADKYTRGKIETHLYQKISVNKYRKSLCSRGATIGAAASIFGICLETYGTKKFSVNPVKGYAFFKYGRTLTQASFIWGMSSLAGYFYYEKNNRNLLNSLTDLYRAQLFLPNIKESE